MLRQDLRHVLRLLRRKPVFSATVVLTLALGVGVNTAIFSVVNSLLLRPLPAQDPEQLVVLAARRAGTGGFSNLSHPDLVDFQTQTTGMLDLAAYRISQIGLSRDARPERVIIHYVTGNFFSLLGLRPAVGRLITPAEGRPFNLDAVVVLSHAYWQRRFNGDPGIVGQKVLANGHALLIVGVAPADFHGASALIAPDAYLPLNMAVIRSATQNDPAAFWTQREARTLQVLGRLKPGVEPGRAQAALNVVAERLAREYPDTNKGLGVRLFPERLARPTPTESNVLPLIAAFFLLLAGTVLVVACVNVANILLVRALDRQRELAVRTSLGASRAALIRQSATESLVLAVIGGAAGILLGQQACHLLESLGEQLDLPVSLNFALDWRVFTYAFGATLLTGLAVGIVPALRASRPNVSELLVEGGRSGMAGAWRRRLQNALIVGQVAGSLVLLIMAGLLVRSLQHAQRMDLGFDPHHVVNVSMDAHLIGLDRARGRAFYDAVIREARALPGVESASASHTVPFGYVHAEADVHVEGRPAVSDHDQPPEVQYNVVDPGYFDTLRIPVREGRPFLERDREEQPLVAIVNESMARRFWPGKTAIGQRFSIVSPTGPFIEVIGRTPDGKYLEPSDEGIPYFFLPRAQHYMSYMTLQVRTARVPADVIQELERVIRSRAPEMPVWDAGSMKDALNGLNGLFVFRVGAALAAMLGLLGLVLAVVGIYGTVAYSASQRFQDMGVRMALGAERGHILRLMLSQGLTIVAIGIVLGLAAAMAVAQAMANLLLGVRSIDPLTYVSVAVLMAAVALLATLIPAIRVLRADPLTALRAQ